MINNYPGKCSVCSVLVAANAGVAIRGGDGKWLVRCAVHSGGAVVASPAPTTARTITAERTGRRTYLRGDTMPVRGLLRDGGCHWDADAKAWWIGDHSAALALVERAAIAPSETAPRKRITHCVGCGCSLDAYQVQRGFKFCSSDCATEARMGSGWSGRTADGGWHQGSDD